MKLCEVYTSIQGEGPNVGKPTQFVRFGGCNLRCPGWGSGTLPDGTVVQGCDTIFSVYPEFRPQWASKSAKGVVDAVSRFPTHVCLTGGEPLTQSSRDLNYVVDQLLDRRHTIDIFTNGSRPIYSVESSDSKQLTVVMDYKLPGSGEFGSFHQPNWDYLGVKDALKFVVKDRHDFDTAVRVLASKAPACQVYFGPVWDAMDPEQLAQWVFQEYPSGKLNIQTHKYIWPPEQRGV